MKKFIGLFTYLFLLPILAFAEVKTPAAAPPTFEEGKDYLTIPSNASTNSIKTKGKITVIEFFNYGCPACSKLDPALEKWLEHKPHNVVFERIPVVFDPDWDVYTKTYLVVHQLDLSQKITPVIFKAIHDDGIDLSNKDAMADFLNGKELKKEKFLNLYNSPGIDIEMAKNKKITNDFLIFQIPGIVIDSKYKVDPSLSGSDPARLIETVDYLIKLESKPMKTAATRKDGQKPTG